MVTPVKGVDLVTKQTESRHAEEHVLVRGFPSSPSANRPLRQCSSLSFIISIHRILIDLIDRPLIDNQRLV
jgi:hypothetical protein